MAFFLCVIIAGILLLCISLQRTYGDIPEKELRRRARAGDALAEALHRAAVYGASLRAILWLMIVLFAAIFFVVVARVTAAWFGIVISALVVWVGFVWLPAQNTTRIGIWLAKNIAPALAWILQYIHPVLDYVNRFVHKHRPVSIHTGLYDKDDVLQLFDQQQVQADNRIDAATLEIVKHALTFGDKTVEEILTPRRVVKAISADETIGPILMTELHDSGFSRLPVYEGKKDNIVGVLYIHDLLGAKNGGLIREIMHPKVCFVHEDQPLTEVLQAILRTHQQLYVVVNSFEEYVGVVTIEDILEEIIGQQIVDEFDQYEDMRAVAHMHARKDHKHLHDEKQNPPIEEPPTVVE